MQNTTQLTQNEAYRTFYTNNSSVAENLMSHFSGGFSSQSDMKGIKQYHLKNGLKANLTDLNKEESDLRDQISFLKTMSSKTESDANQLYSLKQKLAKLSSKRKPNDNYKIIIQGKNQSIEALDKKFKQYGITSPYNEIKRAA